MQWKWLPSEPVKIFQSSAIQKNKTKKNKKIKRKESFVQLKRKIEEYVNIYIRSYSWEIIYQNAQK